jgi:hypothetical protein
MISGFQNHAGCAIACLLRDFYVLASISVYHILVWYQHSFFPFFLCKNQIYSLITCALFIYPVSCIDVSENALRGMKLGQCSMAKTYPLASTYEYTKCMFLFFFFLYSRIILS